MHLPRLVIERTASWIPVLQFVAGIGWGGFCLFIGGYIFTALESVEPGEYLWWQVAEAIITGFPVVLLFGAGIWLIHRYQKESYIQGLLR